MAQTMKRKAAQKPDRQLARRSTPDAILAKKRDRVEALRRLLVKMGAFYALTTEIEQEVDRISPNLGIDMYWDEARYTIEDVMQNVAPEYFGLTAELTAAPACSCAADSRG